MVRNGRRKAELVLLTLLWGGAGLFVLLLIMASWPYYWIHLAGETDPLAWLESVLLIVIAFVCGMIAFSYAAGGNVRRAAWSWGLLAAGFVMLALDERFAVHERIRDRFLKPTGIRLFPWMEAGDWMIPLYAAAGLGAAMMIWRLLAVRRGARLFFAAAVTLSGIAAGMDTLDIRSMDSGSERLLQSVEEALETGAMLAFLSSFILVLTGRMLQAEQAEPGGDML